MDTLVQYIQVLLRIFVYVIQRYQSGDKLSKKEKKVLLAGLCTLCTQFFSTYISNVQLGETWLEISARDNLCVSATPRLEDKDQVPQILQDAQVRAPVSEVSSTLREVSPAPWTRTHEEYVHAVKVARRRSQQD